MKKTAVCYSFSIVMMLGIFACKSTNIEKNSRTPETLALLENLTRIHQNGIMFGHQDDPFYGVGWVGDNDRSDVKSVVGDYPAVLGVDLGRIELGGDKNLDKVPFDAMRKAIIDQYNRGGMTTVSWHLDNPLTGGDSWDVTSKEVVKSILPQGTKHELFLRWLDTVAEFFNSLTTADGTKIPILFRPWHEHTGSWFWWGKELCSIDEYKQLWIMTREYLDEKGANNLLYAYSPDAQGPGEIYMERYPGDDYVDLLGLDCYHRDNEKGIEAYQHTLNTILSFLTEEGEKRNKPIALTETGLEAIPIADWWTNVLFPVLEQYPITYVLVWRNAHDIENHYYAPYPGQLSESDFITFYNNPKTLFSKDLPNLYK